MAKLFWTVLFFWLTFSVALAQDPTKVEPNHYKLDFENEYVQVVFVHYGPHEKSGIHEHPQGVVVNLTDGHLKFTDQSGKVREVFSKRGEARWFPPFKHRVENLSEVPYSAVYIGVKERVSAGAGSTPGTSPGDGNSAKMLADYLLALHAAQDVESPNAGPN